MSVQPTIASREANPYRECTGQPVRKGNMTAVGTRVTAILEAKDGVVRSFGDGVYAGDFELPPEAGGSISVRITRELT